MTLKPGYHAVAPGKLAMVVTYLEMLKKSDLRDASLPQGLEFSRLPRDPEVYRDIFRRIGQDWLWFSRLQLDDLQLCAIIEDPLVELWTLQQDGQREALLELDFRAPYECELAYFGVTRSLIGKGAGAFLMDRAIDMAWSRDIRRFHVHTCTIDSPQALSFYRRSGFEPCKFEIEIADDPRRTGLYPETAAPHVPLMYQALSV